MHLLKYAISTESLSQNSLWLYLTYPFAGLCSISRRRVGKSDNYNNHCTIMRIPDTLCDEIKKILPKEKPFSAIVGRPVTPCRKVLDGILYVI
jgi:hypothetical protein